MSKIRSILLSQAGPGAVSLAFLLGLAAIDPLLIAAPLGGGLGMLANPICFVLVVFTALAADGWRSALLGSVVAAVLGATIGIRTFGDEPNGWRITMIIGTFIVGSTIVAIFGGLKPLFRLRKNAQ